jgi:hypothetical protein
MFSLLTRILSRSSQGQGKGQIRRRKYLQIAFRDALLPEARENLKPELVIADSRGLTSPRPERTGVTGKVGGRPAQLRADGQKIPENLSDANDFEPHI